MNKESKMNLKPEKKKTVAEEVEEVRQILSAVSTELPALIKSVIGAVFSEEAGRNMGRAAAAFYKELKESGIPDDVAVRMTENYVGVFTSLSDLLKHVGKKRKVFITTKKGEELEKEIEKLIKEKITETLQEKKGE
jgi:hypothetical protein